MHQPEIKQRDVPPHQLPDDIHPVLQRIYAARGIKSTGELELGLDQLLGYESLKGIDDAVKLLALMLSDQRRILIVGDYDADGATSTALLMHMLPRLGFQHVQYLLPNRFEYGYGLSAEIVEVARQQKPDLIITVDNGIASVEGVAAANAAGIKVLVTDHHLPGPELPQAEVIVNPNQPDCDFPSKALAGVGVAFYLLMALRTHLRSIDWFKEQKIKEPNLAEVLDIVALGTVADVVPLDQNNRILVEQGLRRIRAGQCQPGIRALIECSGRDYRYLQSTDLGFAVAPRINAAGRLDDMSIGVECLLASDVALARQYAQQLDDMNHSRREISQSMMDEADGMLKELHLSDESIPAIYCLYQQHWHQGVTGILAGRIKDRLHRPTIVFAHGDNNELKGSGRSIPGFHMRDALDAIASENPGLITRFGGHAMAAGLSLDKDNFDVLQQKLLAYASKVLSEDQLQKTLLTDGELTNDELGLSFVRVLEAAGPWGQNHPAPVFQGQFNVIQRRRVGADQRHLKLVLESSGNEIDAIAFSMSDDIWPESLTTVELVYRISANRFRGVESAQIMVEHVIS